MIRSIRGVNMALCGLLAAATTGFVLSDKVAIAGYSNCPNEIGTIGTGAQCVSSPQQTPLGTDCQAGTDAYNRSYCCLYRTVKYRLGPEAVPAKRDSKRHLQLPGGWGAPAGHLRRWRRVSGVRVLTPR